MLKQFKAFYNKYNSDYSSGNVDPFDYHKTFYFILKKFQVLQYQHPRNQRVFNQNTIIFVFGVIATILSFISLLHGVAIFDIPHITETVAYFLALLYEQLILSCKWKNLPQYHNLLDAMKNDFVVICNKGQKYRRNFFRNQLETWKICLLSCISITIIVTSMVLFTIISMLYFLITKSDDGMENRPLLFPLWLYGINLSSSPLYEALVCFCNICIILYAYSYMFMLQTQIVWIRHITSKADIIICSIQDLLVDIYPTRGPQETKYFSKLLRSRLKDIVIQHQSMFSLLEDYAKVYKKLLLFEQKFFGPIICLSAYCVVQKLEDGEINGVLMMLCIGAVFVYFIPSYLCTYLATKVQSICDACWNIEFWKADPMIRPYMVLIMQRSMHPLPLNAAGFEEISIQTFFKKMASAYSSFNMLRHLNL